VAVKRDDQRPPGRPLARFRSCIFVSVLLFPHPSAPFPFPSRPALSPSPQASPSRFSPFLSVNGLIFAGALLFLASYSTLLFSGAYTHPFRHFQDSASRPPSVSATSPGSPIHAPTLDQIDAVIQMATSSRSSQDGRPIPLKDTRTQLYVGNVRTSSLSLFLLFILFSAPSFRFNGYFLNMRLGSGLNFISSRISSSSFLAHLLFQI